MTNEPGLDVAPERPATEHALPASDEPAGAPSDALAERPDAFAAFGLHDALLRALAELGYEEPTPIQREAIPPLLEGRDVLAEAPTGTGKTAAFALPALHRIATDADGTGDRGRQSGPRALVLVPTRELAMQVAQAVHRYGRDLGTRALPIFGGQAYGQQLRGLERGVEVVVATPGRALDHLQRGSLRLDAVATVILDEADEMLDMGFAEDLDAILGAVPAEHQTALFSATISPAIARIAARHLRDPIRVTVAHKRPKGEEIAKVRQVAYVVPRAHKLPALCRILDVEAPSSALVFARTRTEVDELGEALGGRGYSASPLHGGMAQEQRDRVMNRFRDGDLEVLVATDVAARGLDIPHVSHVVNYDVPSAPEAYVHRIGRTGRAGREGTAITLVEPREHRLLRNIESFTRTRLELAKLPTVADLRERRLEVLRATLREALVADSFDRYRAVVEPLADEWDLVDIALAAVSLADPAGARAEDEVELPAATLPRPFEPRPTGPRSPGGPRPGPGGADRGGPPGPRRAGPWPTRMGPTSPPGIARLFIGGGRRAGIRPADLVGAITNEAGIGGREIGAIEIGDSFAIVEVPEQAVERVIDSLRDATIRGRKLHVRRERGDAPSDGPRREGAGDGPPRKPPTGPPRERAPRPPGPTRSP